MTNQQLVVFTIAALFIVSSIEAAVTLQDGTTLVPTNLGSNVVTYPLIFNFLYAGTFPAGSDALTLEPLIEALSDSLYAQIAGQYVNSAGTYATTTYDLGTSSKIAIAQADSALITEGDIVTYLSNTTMFNN